MVTSAPSPQDSNNSFGRSKPNPSPVFWIFVCTATSYPNMPRAARSFLEDDERPVHPEVVGKAGQDRVFQRGVVPPRAKAVTCRHLQNCLWPANCQQHRDAPARGPKPQRRESQSREEAWRAQGHLSPAVSPIRNGGEGEDPAIVRFWRDGRVLPIGRP